MILLPYVYTVSTLQHITVHSYTILTIGGIQLWSEEIDLSGVEDSLSVNDLYTDSIQQYGDLCLCSIDSQKTTLSDFFTWNELTTTDTDTFCWRTLYTFGENQNWLPHPNEYIGEYSYQTICDHIRKTSKPSSLSIK